MKLVAITPKGKGFDPKRSKIGVALLRIGRATQGKAGDYPTARTKYRRTGALGRGWTVRGPVQQGGALAVITGTKVKYGKYVKGLKKKDPKQRKLFKRLGWASIVDDAEESFKAHKGGLIRAIQDKAV
ncbi:hypothetical protein LCGC14_1742370 [marine sediment metagenome]|uniref:Uncharacterized protein n=1 Tax=marine sediment metagenome TaxID=412755 RepID=A0A0F9H682_9ZZZZ